VNLISDKQVVKELIQDEFTVKNVSAELNKILHDTITIQQIKSDYKQLQELLQQGGNASRKAAEIIIDFLRSTSLQKA
jgi:lipid-A-disaccharide synthase